MATRHSKFRFEQSTRDALNRIVVQISACLGEAATAADVLRWLIARHDPQNNPGRELTREELIGFPDVYPPEIRRRAAETRRAALAGPAPLPPDSTDPG